MNRTVTITQKVKTPFGSMYIHIETDIYGRPVGGHLSDPGKEPKSVIAELVENLSGGLDSALKIVGDDGPQD